MNVYDLKEGEDVRGLYQKANLGDILQRLNNVEHILSKIGKVNQSFHRGDDDHKKAISQILKKRMMEKKPHMMDPNYVSFFGGADNNQLVDQIKTKIEGINKQLGETITKAVGYKNEKENEITNLKEQIEDLNKKIKDLNKMIEMKTESSKQLLEDIRKKQEESKDNTQEINELKQKSQQLEDEKNKLLQEKTNLENKLKESQQLLNDVDEKVQSLNNEFPGDQ